MVAADRNYGKLDYGYREMDDYAKCPPFPSFQGESMATYRLIKHADGTYGLQGALFSGRDLVLATVALRLTAQQVRGEAEKMAAALGEKRKQVRLARGSVGAPGEVG